MRDSLRTQLTVTLLALTIVPLLLSGLVMARQSFQAQEQQVLGPVSYTHLTLPTIYSV